MPNAVLAETALAMPVLAVAGEHAFGSKTREVARNVHVVADTGHLLVEEDPDTVLPLILDFVADA
jgi:pimeloyl-ACP methyl ester carboxylesterase